MGGLVEMSVGKKSVTFKPSLELCRKIEKRRLEGESISDAFIRVLQESVKDKTLTAAEIESIKAKRAQNIKLRMERRSSHRAEMLEARKLKAKARAEAKAKVKAAAEAEAKKKGGEG